MQCPHCEQLSSLHDFKCFSRNEKYAMDLGYVWQHRRDMGGCGHCFSMVDQRIIVAYLAGDLVPRSVVNELRGLIEELKASINYEDKQPALEVGKVFQ